MQLFLHQEPALILEVLAEPVAVRVREDTEIGLERLIDVFRCLLSGLAAFDALRELSYHATLCLRAQCSVVRQENVPQEVDALAIFTDRNFSRMKVEMQMCSEKSTDGLQQRLQIFSAFRHCHEVIRVADVVLDLECVFDELIELVEVDVGEELRGEVSDGDAGVPEESRVLCGEAPDNLTEKRDGLRILQTLLKNAE